MELNKVDSVNFRIKKNKHRDFRFNICFHRKKVCKLDDFEAFEGFSCIGTSSNILVGFLITQRELCPIRNT